MRRQLCAMSAQGGPRDDRVAVCDVVVVLATIVGLVLWPIRMLSRRKQPSPDAKEASTPDGSA